MSTTDRERRDEGATRGEARPDVGDPSAAVLPVGVVAEHLGVSVAVVRRFDSEGIVEPARTEGQQRRYSREDVARLERALELTREGIPPAGIRRILALEGRLSAYEDEHAVADEPGEGGSDGSTPTR